MAHDLMANSRREARGYAIAFASVAALALLGQQVITRPIESHLPPKSSARVAFPQVAVPVPEAYAPRGEDVVAQVTALKAGIKWPAMQSVALAIDAQPDRTAESKSTTKSKLASVAPLPPRRPTGLATAASITPEGPPAFVASAEPRTRIGGFELPGFAPTGVALMRKLGDVGSKFGDVGASIGKLLRISAL
jgi:hypothetical protein